MTEKIARQAGLGKALVVSVLLLGFGAGVQGQGLPVVRFETPAEEYEMEAGGRLMFVREYREAGMVFRALGPMGFMQILPGASKKPSNGTSYINQTRPGEAIEFQLEDGSAFDLIAVDLAEHRSYYGSLEPAVVTFVGYRGDDLRARTTFTTDGLALPTRADWEDFETFQFGPEFSGLTRVVIEELEGPPGWSLDNLVFRPVPEPSAVALLGLGFGWLWLGKRQCRAKGG